MDNTVFVNRAFNMAIKTYLNYKNRPEDVKFNSFLVVVIRMLALIFDELDIVNPYMFENEDSLNVNLTKFGTSLDDVSKLKQMMDDYYENENPRLFVDIQKIIVDMFVKKKLTINIKEAEISSFKNLLFSPYADNPMIVSYNFMIASDPLEVINYFDEQFNKNEKKVISKPKEKLNLEAYEILKYSLEDIDAMNAEEVDEVNKKVYSYFDINSNAINKKYLLDKAVYDHNHPKPSFSTGNGYVDIIFILGIITTVAMVLILIAAIV